MYKYINRQLSIGLDASILIYRHCNVKVETLSVRLTWHIWEWEGFLDEAEFLLNSVEWRDWRWAKSN
jgi:hypothetical protein